MYVLDTVFVEKGGEIIPKIAVDLSKRLKIRTNKKNTLLQSECHTELVRNEGSITIVPIFMDVLLKLLEGSNIIFREKRWTLKDWWRNGGLIIQ
jgi:predicted metal-dependent RNase